MSYAIFKTVASFEFPMVDSISEEKPQEGFSCLCDTSQIGYVLEGASLRAPFSLEKRAFLRDKVSKWYDDLCKSGFTFNLPSDMTDYTNMKAAGFPHDFGSGPTILMLDRDVPLLSTAVAIAITILSITPEPNKTAFANSVSMSGYYFGNSSYDLTQCQLAALFMLYKNARTAKFQAHKRIKIALDTGAYPVEADLITCTLTLSDIEGI